MKVNKQYVIRCLYGSVQELLLGSPITKEIETYGLGHLCMHSHDGVFLFRLEYTPYPSISFMSGLPDHRS